VGLRRHRLHARHRRHRQADGQRPAAGGDGGEPALVDGFRARTRYFNTFASSPLQAAVGMAVLDVIERDGLVENVAAVGAALKQALAERQPRWDADRRRARPRPLHRRRDGQGPVGQDARSRPWRRCVNRLKDKGFLTAPAGAFGNVVKIRPPLVFSQADAEAFLAAFDATVAELHG
jgi:4-aminobutyrate aminotransferase-like enzyme